MQFILHKANISDSEVAIIDIDKKDLVREAEDIVRDIEGHFITRVDLFVAYLILTEPTTRLLFNKAKEIIENE